MNDNTNQQAFLSRANHTEHRTLMKEACRHGLKASQVVNEARKYKNYQEKSKLGTREQMWDFHWAAGNKNYTIFAMLYKDYTQRDYQGQAWCAMFGSVVLVLALMNQCGASAADALAAAKHLYGGDLPYNCQLFVNQHKGDPRLDHIPEPGAAVIFHTGTKYGHFGLVSGVDKNGGGFTSVEGNTSGGADKVDPDGGAVVEKWHSMSPLTYFWHFNYVKEDAAKPTGAYPISTGLKGLKVTAGRLPVHTYAGGEPTGEAYALGESIYPSEKTFVDGKAWFHTDKGWCQAWNAEGWVLEDNGRWWYVMDGYTFSVNSWQEIDGEWYYFDNTGYMAKSQWISSKGKEYYVTASGAMARNSYIKSADKELYYWVGADGAWEAEWDIWRPEG